MVDHFPAAASAALSENGMPQPRASGAVRPDLVSETFSTLRDLIVAGRLAPGTAIIERVTAERLGVSRSTVRSALQRLTLQGYVLSSPLETYRRAVVAPLTVEDMADLYTLIGAFDGIAARLAAQMEPEARSLLVRDLEATNADLLRSSRLRRDFNRVYELDDDFHRLYVASVRAPRLVAQYNILIPQGERYGRLYASALIDEIDVSVREHEAIIGAIDDGDPVAAELHARANRSNAIERFRAEMTMLGEHGAW